MVQSYKIRGIEDGHNQPNLWNLEEPCRPRIDGIGKIDAKNMQDQRLYVK